VIAELESLGLEPRTLGRTDYPSDYPLREVLVIARHCSGGVILGFEQLAADTATVKRGTKSERHIASPTLHPSPWNHLEAGVLFALGLPLLVFKEEGIDGGVFDAGGTDVFVHRMPTGRLQASSGQALRDVLLNWQRRVRTHYYGDD
jgi:hypothetical protein